MYNKEAGVIECDGCEVTIEGCGYSVSEDDSDPRGCYCWECAVDEIDRQLCENNSEATIVRRSENWIRACYDLGVDV